MLVLAAPSQSFSTTEEQAITNFVQAGGGLMFLGVRNLNTNINSLLSPWGIQFDNTLIESPQQSCCPQNFNLSSFANHPGLGPSPAFTMNWGGSLNLSTGAVPLAQTTAAEWKSLSGQMTQQPGDPSGPFVAAAAAQPGTGRVFAVSDNAFDDTVLGYTPDYLNLNLFLSATAWLSAPLNPTPSPPSPIFSLCDVNRSGNPDVVDVQTVINQVLGLRSATNDLNGDGLVNVVDVQSVVNAVVGFGCTVG